MYSTHEMRMVRTQESGLEEWACPTCGRRMLLRWPPDYEKRVIETGDEKACHVGSAEDTVPEPPDTPADETTADAAAAARCNARRRWLRETGAHNAAAHVIPP
ncbi:hypothetical protein [Actinomadura sp. 7K507]|uniref:hypothetical protein n=1 Tax=Actinomadura sp. 7K507 TaxID=2530365 RepID=UPI0010437C18|nr:hypothetical protein [Actinomadura sp. 7K507]TDC76148.1 hypothetical protein E1285_40320 [Actinomadura sp. 7K507]